nr:DUF5615 family PIN-like protein [Thiococcus pfennigii]
MHGLGAQPPSDRGRRRAEHLAGRCRSRVGWGSKGARPRRPVHPAPRTPQAVPVKFLCDEMLKRLGQWLRVAGYDVLILPDGTDDRTLVRRARAEGRILLTRDRQMAEQNAALADLILLDCGDLDDCVAALHPQCDIDWMHAPFTRCMSCNAPLVAATDAQRRTMPERARHSATMALYCPRCDQVFWDGSHVARMRRRLAFWNRRHRGGPPDQHLT